MSGHAGLGEPRKRGRPWSDARREKAVFGRSVDDKLRLTEREAECLQLIGDGFTAREVANKLFLSYRTVQGHLLHASSKLDAVTSWNAFVEAVHSGQCVCPCRRGKEKNE